MVGGDGADYVLRAFGVIALAVVISMMWMIFFATILGPEPAPTRVTIEPQEPTPYVP